MEYDTAKLEETVLALLGAFEFENGRAWKRYDFAIMESLHPVETESPSISPKPG